MALTFGGKRRPGGGPPRTPLDPLEQALADRLARIMRQQNQNVSETAIEAAIEALDPDSLMQMLFEVAIDAIGNKLEDVLRSVFLTSADGEARRILRETPRPGLPEVVDAGVRLPSGIIIPKDLAPVDTIGFTITPIDRLTLDYIDPRAVEYARRRAAALVVDINNANRMGLRRLITDSVAQGRTPAQTARLVRQTVGLHTRWIRAVANFDRQQTAALMRQGMTPMQAQAKADVLTKQYRDRLIRRRAEMIARTEIQTAQNMARQTSWDAGNKAGYVDGASMKVWRAATSTMSGTPPCDVCSQMNGQRVQWNAAFASGHVMPPAHPHCRCTAVLVPPSRGLSGLPSQDLDSWLARLDAMDAEAVA